MIGINKKIAIVQHYINVRKNKEVNIKIESLSDIAKLEIAYKIAVNYFEENNLNIELLQ